MDATLDTILAELDLLKQQSDFIAVLPMTTPSKYGDPGVVTADEYPYFFAEPLDDNPISETVGRAGYDVRAFTINVGLVINQSDYFNPLVSELPGERQLVRAMGILSKRFRRLSKSNLNNTVRKLTVASIAYTSDLRNNAYVRAAIVTLVVQKQFQHEE